MSVRCRIAGLVLAVLLATCATPPPEPLLLERAAAVMIEAGSTVEGLIYTHPDEGLKAIRVHLLGLGGDGEATTLVSVPGALRSRDFALSEPPRGMTSIGLGALPAWLAGQPCCRAELDRDPRGSAEHRAGR